MTRRLLAVCMLLGVPAFAVISSGHGTMIEERVSDGAPSADVQKPITCYMNDGTVLQTSGQRDHLQLVISPPGIQPVSIALPYAFNEVSSIAEIVRDQAAVIGDLGGGASEVEIVDVRQYRIADNFLGYCPAPSPDGRFIAFVKFYPTHPGTYTTDFVLVYDAARSPATNRPPHGPNILLLEDVGTAVYPPGIKTQDNNVGPPPDQSTQDGMYGVPWDEVNQVMSDHERTRFYWAPDSSRFAFGTQHILTTNDETSVENRATPARVILPRRKVTWLVLVDMKSPKGPQTRVFVAPVCGESRRFCADSLKGVEFRKDGLKARFGSIHDPSVEVVEVKYDQFKAP